MARAKNKIALWLLIAICAPLTGCQKPPKEYRDDWQGQLPSQFEQIPTLEMLPAYKAAAYAGSGPAANALSTYYLKADRTGAQEFYWNSVSAENGDAVGQYNVAMDHLEPNSPYFSQRRAIYWLKISAGQGHSLATRVLADLNKR
ncbi:hypothetical protein [Lysobacter sp. Hz 25]|uniref:hypothetical protein n=1 Tax=Lysobacter sp. Hz 25 TaxID=3383698 RepID=UPI0038D4485E